MPIMKDVDDNIRVYLDNYQFNIEDPDFYLKNKLLVRDDDKKWSYGEYALEGMFVLIDTLPKEFVKKITKNKLHFIDLYCDINDIDNSANNTK